MKPNLSTSPDCDLACWQALAPRDRVGFLWTVCAVWVFLPLCALGTTACEAPAAAPALNPTASASQALSAVPPVVRQPIGAPLVVHPTNPIWLADGATGRAVRLAGHQMFNDMQDHLFAAPYTLGLRAGGGVTGPARTLDFAAYLDFAADRDLNFLRAWISFSVGKLPDSLDAEKNAAPAPYRRSGPGSARDGRPKFDLDAWEPAFFERLRQRVSQAGQRGIYVSIMLFEVYGFISSTLDGSYHDTFAGNYWNRANNIQGLHVDTNGDGTGMEFFYSTRGSALRQRQEAWVKKVIDTVGDLPNVVYEVANELGARDFQYDMIQLIRDYETSKRLPRHLVWMSPGGRIASGAFSEIAAAEVYAGPAELWGFSEGWAGFRADPPGNDKRRPGFWDGDHNFTADWRDSSKAWKAFTRGYQYVLYDAPFEAPAQESAAWERHRRSIGMTNRFAALFRDLGRMLPRGELTSTGYALADAGSEYLVYKPDGVGSFTVTLPAGDWDVTWLNPASSQFQDAPRATVAAAGPVTFSPPLSGEAALHLSSATAAGSFPKTCVPGKETLCLRDGRFQVQVVWRDFKGAIGAGNALQFRSTNETGLFWFFSPNNLELMIKVLDGGPLNGSLWTFYGALTNVEYWATVTDMHTGARRIYYNPPGELCGRGDTQAFVSKEVPGAPAPSPAAASYLTQVTDPCGPDALCLGGGRFKLELDWRVPWTGKTGRGVAVPGTADTGFFWFFDAKNLELAVKVLDGRAINGHYWIFYGSLSNVEFTLRVTDKLTGAVKSYKGSSCGGADTTAF